ncbi:MAG: SPOR domain-containing protein, partial [Muribaculaceae bacterium]|nr:SPOR domain-containing protein [Muribaculaceae bacterium]
VYQLFESPFWRVRLGDFRSRNEATEVMEEVKRSFPSYSPFLRVVRDRIN